jgi:DNA-binding NarL/FixJ family response regulator
MQSNATVVLVGAEPEWPDGLGDALRSSGFAPVHTPLSHHLELLALSGGVRAVVVDARHLSFGDIVSLRRLRGTTPEVALIVVGSSAVPQSMKDAFESDATCFVSRSQLPALLLDALQARHE